MKTFLSILSVKTNSFSNEKIVIGLLAVSANQVHFGYSKSKIKLLNKFSTDQDMSSFVISLLNQIKLTVSTTNQELGKLQESLLVGKSNFSEDYFNHLNTFNNGVLNFSKPVDVNYDFTENDYSKYYLNFIGEPYVSDKKATVKSLHQKLKPFFNKKGLEHKVDLHYTFNPNNFKGILKDCSN
jgi:hypothetical protein